MASVDRVELLGLPFDPLTMQSAVERCLEWCRGPRATRTVITINAWHANQIRRDAALREACLAGDLILADGMSVVWTFGLAGVPLPGRVTGVDLMANLLAAAGRLGLRVYFLGARREVVEKLAAQSAERHPGLVVAGCRDGFFGPADHQAIVDEIRRAEPHLLFVGMPSPFKEVWCERHRAALSVPVVMGVGGTFDVLAGFVRRAPRLFQRTGMEWAWRLLMEPRKMWRRYLVNNSEFIWLAARQVAARRRQGRRPSPDQAGPGVGGKVKP